MYELFLIKEILNEILIAKFMAIKYFTGPIWKTFLESSFSLFFFVL